MHTKGAILNKETNNPFDFISELTGDDVDLKPLSDGLGFKDRVSTGEPDFEETVEQASAYAGNLDIGIKSPGDGDVVIGPKGSISVESTVYPQPFLRHSGHDGLVKQRPKKVKGSLVASTIDLLTLFSGFMFMIAILTLFSSLELSVDRLVDLSTYVVFNYFVLFAALYLSYTVVLRSLFGKTVGEWACRIQLGLKKDQEESSYPIKVMMREIVYLLTGVLVLPVMSVLLSKDLGYYISGLQNYLEEK